MSRVSVRIRPAEHPDADAVAALVEGIDTRAGTFSGRAMPEVGRDRLTARLREIMDEGTRTLLVAVDDAAGTGEGAIVGLLVAATADIGVIECTPALHVTHLLVSPKHRRRGVGRALLAAATHLADERGVDRVLATVNSGSREANRYLARLGFAPLVVHRVATTATLRRSLGISDASERMAVLRRARLVRAQRSGGLGRAVGRGA